MVLPPQRRAGVRAQLIGQRSADPFVALQGVRLPAAPVQGEHELPGQALIERLRRGEGVQLIQHGGVLPPDESQIVAVERHGQALFGQGGADAIHPRRVQRGEGFALPQLERLREQCRGGVGVVGRAGLVGQVVEAVQVDP